MLAPQAEFPQQHIADGRVLVIGVVGIFRLGPGTFVGNEAALEGSHPVPAKNGAVPAGPQPPKEVQTELALGGAALVIVGFSGGLFGIVQEFLSGTGLAADGKFHQLAVFRHGDTAVEQQVAVMDLIQAAFGI